jgi:hypothetical protein
LATQVPPSPEKPESQVQFTPPLPFGLQIAFGEQPPLFVEQGLAVVWQAFPTHCSPVGQLLVLRHCTQSLFAVLHNGVDGREEQSAFWPQCPVIQTQ